MKNKILFIFLLVIFITLSGMVNAQQKLEEETRLKEMQLPQWARKFHYEIGDSLRLNWYQEKNLKGNSVEAKFRYNKRRFSVEFDTLGTLQDVEVEVKQKKLPASVQKLIEEQLDSMFTAYRVNKVQEQYMPEREKLREFILNFSPKLDEIMAYEMVLTGKESGEAKHYEFTFSKEGKLIKIEEIIFRNTDNLAY